MAREVKFRGKTSKGEYVKFNEKNWPFGATIEDFATIRDDDVILVEENES